MREMYTADGDVEASGEAFDPGYVKYLSMNSARLARLSRFEDTLREYIKDRIKNEFTKLSDEVKTMRLMHTVNQIVRDKEGMGKNVREVLGFTVAELERRLAGMKDELYSLYLEYNNLEASLNAKEKKTPPISAQKDYFAKYDIDIEDPDHREAHIKHVRGRKEELMHEAVLLQTLKEIYTTARVAHLSGDYSMFPASAEELELPGWKIPEAKFIPMYRDYSFKDVSSEKSGKRKKLPVPRYSRFRRQGVRRPPVFPPNYKSTQVRASHIAYIHDYMGDERLWKKGPSHRIGHLRKELEVADKETRKEVKKMVRRLADYWADIEESMGFTTSDDDDVSKKGKKRKLADGGLDDERNGKDAGDSNKKRKKSPENESSLKKGATDPAKDPWGSFESLASVLQEPYPSQFLLTLSRTETEDFNLHEPVVRDFGLYPSTVPINPIDMPAESLDEQKKKSSTNNLNDADDEESDDSDIPMIQKRMRQSPKKDSPKIVQKQSIPKKDVTRKKGSDSLSTSGSNKENENPQNKRKKALEKGVPRKDSPRKKDASPAKKDERARSPAKASSTNPLAQNPGLAKEGSKSQSTGNKLVSPSKRVSSRSPAKEPQPPTKVVPSTPAQGANGGVVATPNSSIIGNLFSFWRTPTMSPAKTASPPKSASRVLGGLFTGWRSPAKADEGIENAEDVSKPGATSKIAKPTKANTELKGILKNNTSSSENSEGDSNEEMPKKGARINASSILGDPETARKHKLAFSRSTDMQDGKSGNQAISPSPISCNSIHANSRQEGLLGRVLGVISPSRSQNQSTAESTLKRDQKKPPRKTSQTEETKTAKKRKSSPETAAAQPSPKKRRKSVNGSNDENDETEKSLSPHKKSPRRIPLLPLPSIPPASDNSSNDSSEYAPIIDPHRKGKPFPKDMYTAPDGTPISRPKIAAYRDSFPSFIGNEFPVPDEDRKSKSRSPTKKSVSPRRRPDLIPPLPPTPDPAAPSTFVPIEDALKRYDELEKEIEIEKEEINQLSLERELGQFHIRVREHSLEADDPNWKKNIRNDTVPEECIDKANYLKSQYAGLLEHDEKLNKCMKRIWDLMDEKDALGLGVVGINPATRYKLVFPTKTADDIDGRAFVKKDTDRIEKKATETRTAAQKKKKKAEAVKTTKGTKNSGGSNSKAPEVDLSRLYEDSDSDE